MKIPFLTTSELQKMRVEDLDNFDLEFSKWLKNETHLTREQRLKLTTIKYKKLLLETLHRRNLIC